MGSHMKKAIFEEQTSRALKNWHRAAKERNKQRDKSINGGDLSSVGGLMSAETTPSRSTSPIHLLQKYKNKSTDLESVLNSPKSYYSETDLSDNELHSHGHLSRYTNPKPANNNEIHNTDFSFSQG